MKTTITLALVLGGCNYDYAIMESPDEPSSETIIVYEPTNIPSGNSQVQEEVTDTGSDVVDTVIVDAADTDTGTPPAGDTDESTAETEEDTGTFDDTSGSFEDPPTVDSDPPVDDGVDVDTDAEAPPVIDSDPPVEPEPPSDPEWRTVYFEDFEDGSSDLVTFNGGCGGQGISSGSLNMFSDWNGARVPLPEFSTVGLRLTTTVTLGSSTWWAVIRWRSNEIAWNYNDNAGFSYHLAAIERPGLWVGGALDTLHVVARNVPVELAIEEYAGAYVVVVDGVAVADGYSSEAPEAGHGLEFHSNGDCYDNLMNIQDVHIEVAD